VEQFPKLLNVGDVAVEALLAKRTFWEKATILHAEYYRPAEKALPDRYSRHYYDLPRLGEYFDPTDAVPISDPWRIPFAYGIRKAANSGHQFELNEIFRSRRSTNKPFSLIRSCQASLD
jgi:hypothetical protein